MQQPSYFATCGCFILQIENASTQLVVKWAMFAEYTDCISA